MTLDLEQLKRVAQTAQAEAPGWWMVDRMTSEEAYEAGNKDAEDDEGYSIYASNHARIVHDGELQRDIAQHIATFSPDVVLKLLTHIRELENTATQALDGWLSLTNRVPSVVEREHIARIVDLRKKVPR